jgi:thiamine biosynthesis lipoprotein
MRFYFIAIFVSTKNKKMQKFTAVFVILILIVGCKNEKVSEHKIEGSALGTTFHITYIGVEIDSFSTKVDSIVFAINHGLSTYQKNSLISSFNSNSNEIWNNPADADHFMNDMQHFVEMVSLSQKIAAKTNGAFDPSAAAVFELYNAAKKEGVFMDSIKVQEALSHQGMSKLLFDPNGFPIKQDTLLTLNFNAIAKGYLVDVIAEYLDSKGIAQYMVEIGGEVRVKGKNLENKSWQIGVNVPLLEAKADDFFKVMELENVSMATSGNYQNFYMVDGKLIGHTIDPRTGKPILSNLKSASLLHTDCAVADAYATACMVMGLDSAKQFVAADTALSAFFIYEENDELKGIYVE